MDLLQTLKNKMDDENYNKIVLFKNNYINKFISEYIELCNPAKIFVYTGSAQDINFIREQALKNNEESKLNLQGHTVHFDNIKDQARDKTSTQLLVPKNVKFDSNLNYIEREQGLKEVKGILKDIMKSNTMYISFFLIGPNNSDFSIPAVQITDSAYVTHSEYLLYRNGYEDFKKMKNKKRFFKFIHSAGELNEFHVSKNLDKRRIYIDLVRIQHFVQNSQYGGNSLGLKKLSMRFAIQLALKKGWLCEHMFLMGVNGPNGRKTYFKGAFPSACGKTSTSMLPLEKIVGDDICYLKIVNKKIMGVNVENGMFGIIEGVNASDDPIIWDLLHKENEIIFSNVLVKENNMPYWNGSGEPEPEKGLNYSGEWYKGKKDDTGAAILASNKNARFTTSLAKLPNLDENLNNPKGVEVKGIIYGGRDSDTSVPVEEAFNYQHGIITKGAALESETTAATLGQTGKRVFDPMSNMDFLSIPIAKYIKNNLDFHKKSNHKTKIFSVNYFIKGKDNNFLNDKVDKAVWIKWMELRCHEEAEGITTPTGVIPKYETLKDLFKKILNKEYTQKAYEEQFTIRIPENLQKIERIVDIYKNKIEGTPELLFKILAEQKNRLIDLQKQFGDYVSPLKLG